MENKKIVIHQPSKYGDFLNLIPIVQKLMENGYEVWYPHCSTTKELIPYFNNIKTFIIGPVDIYFSQLFAEGYNAKLINCQTSPKYDSLCTIYGGKLFIEELKYYVVNDNVELNIEYKDKYNFMWNHNQEKELKLLQLLNINNNEEYIVTHTIGENGRISIMPIEEKRRRIEVEKIPGYTLLDWYLVIEKSQAVYTIQSSVQCFVDSIKYKLNNKPMFLLNDTSNPDRLLVPAYGWNFKYFVNKRLR